MATDSIRESVEQWCVERARAIKIADGYSQDVRNVIREWPNEVRLEHEQPAVYLFAGPEFKKAIGDDNDPFSPAVDEISNVMELNAIFLATVDPVDREKVGIAFAADVERALTRDPNPTMVAGSVVDVVPRSVMVYTQAIYKEQAGGHFQFWVRFTTAFGNPRTPA